MSYKKMLLTTLLWSMVHGSYQKNAPLFAGFNPIAAEAKTFLEEIKKPNHFYYEIDIIKVGLIELIKQDLFFDTRLFFDMLSHFDKTISTENVKQFYSDCEKSFKATRDGLVHNLENDKNFNFEFFIQYLNEQFIKKAQVVNHIISEKKVNNKAQSELAVFAQLTAIADALRCTYIVFKDAMTAPNPEYSSQLSFSDSFDAHLIKEPAHTDNIHFKGFNGHDISISDIEGDEHHMLEENSGSFNLDSSFDSHLGSFATEHSYDKDQNDVIPLGEEKTMVLHDDKKILKDDQKSLSEEDVFAESHPEFYYLSSDLLQAKINAMKNDLAKVLRLQNGTKEQKSTIDRLRNDIEIAEYMLDKKFHFKQ